MDAGDKSENEKIKITFFLLILWLIMGKQSEILWVS